MGETNLAFGDQGNLLRALKALKRRLQLVDVLKHASEGLFYAFVLDFVIAVFDQLDMFPFDPLVLYWLLPCTGALFFTTMALLRKQNDLRILLDADMRLNLKERLSTALEIQRTGRTTRLSSLAVEDAASRAMEVIPRKVYPLLLPTKAKWLPLLLALVLLATIVDFKPILSEIRGDGPEMPLEQEGRRIEEMGKRLAERARRDRLPEALKLGREMERLGERMQKEGLSIEQSREELLDLADSARERRETILQRREGPFRDVVEPPHVAAETESRDLAGSGDSEGSTIEEEVGSEAPDQNEAEDFHGRAPEPGTGYASADEDIGALEEAEEGLRQSAEKLLDSSELAGSDTVVEGSEPGWDGGRRGGEAGEKTGEEGGTGIGGAPGDKAVTDVPVLNRKGKTPSEPKDTVVEVSDREEDALEVLIRSLPSETGSDTNQDTRIQEYEKQVEEAILKEDIPLSMKEYVRDYFLMIGVK